MRKQTIETKRLWGVAGFVILAVLAAPAARAQSDAPEYGIYDGNPGLMYHGSHKSNAVVEMVQLNGEPAFRVAVGDLHGFKESHGFLFIGASGVVCHMTGDQQIDFQLARGDIVQAKAGHRAGGPIGFEFHTKSKEYKVDWVDGVHFDFDEYRGPNNSPLEMLLNQMLNDFPSALAEFQKVAQAGQEAAALHPQQAQPQLAQMTTQAAAFAMQAGTAPSTPMPAKPAAEGASLADTMKFIQDKLNESGQVHFAASITDGTGGNPASLNLTQAWTNVAADAATCRISYHSSLAANEGVAAGGDAAIAAWEIEKIEVLPMEQFFALAAAKAGRPEWSVQVQPPVSVLRAQLHGGGFAAFAFYDADLADRMAKAMVHASELCGGGNKEPF